MIDHGFRVRLGGFGIEDDKIRAFNWRNNPAIYRWTRQCAPISWEHHDAWFKSSATDPAIRMYKIFPYSPDRQMVGVCGLTSIDWISRRAEFSLYVGPEFQGRGFGRAALHTLFSHGFLALGLNSIWGETFEGNPAEKMFTQTGMKKDGTRRAFYYREGAFIDAHLYSILRSEWSLRVPEWEALCAAPPGGTPPIRDLG